MKTHLIYLFFREYYLARRIAKRFNSSQDVLSYQENKIQEHLNRIVPLSPFYQKQFEDLSFNEWMKLPIINKSTMMDNFNDLNTVGVDKEEAFSLAMASELTRDFSPKLENVTVGLSSGTSGNRGLFLISEREQVRWAGNVLGKVMPTSLFFGKKQVISFFLRANSNLYNSVNNPKIAFHFFDLLDDLAAHVHRLNQTQPTILVAPASMIYLLAKEKEAGRLKINPIKIISVAEVLNEEDKVYMQSVFQQLIHQIYQCTEGFLAYTCSHGTIHLNEDLVHIEKEYIDKKNQKFIPIITDFTRTSQPIIRYRLNDILTEGRMCTCGSYFTAIRQIDGRCDDVFYGQRLDNEGVRILFADFIRRAIITTSDNLLNYKVKQYSLTSIEVQIDSDSTNGEQLEINIRKNLEKYFEEMNCIIPDIRFRKYIEPEKGDKLRRVQRCFQIEGIFE